MGNVSHLILILGMFSLQYQCHAPKDKEDLAASAFEAGWLVN
jgi:hypothetical protein